MTRTLKSQLAQIGYARRHHYVAVSHAHIDHTANLNGSPASTWLTPPAERDFMWAENNPRVNPSFYTGLKASAVKLIDKDETTCSGTAAIIKAAPGHTPGHQVLILRLAEPDASCRRRPLSLPARTRAVTRPPDNEFNVQASAASRVRSRNTSPDEDPIWIQHDFGGNAKLRKPPAYYE